MQAHRDIDTPAGQKGLEEGGAPQEEDDITLEEQHHEWGRIFHAFRCAMTWTRKSGGGGRPPLGTWVLKPVGNTANAVN
jgi:hypothetical protein